MIPPPPPKNMASLSFLLSYTRSMVLSIPTRIPAVCSSALVCPLLVSAASGTLILCWAAHYPKSCCCLAIIYDFFF